MSYLTIEKWWEMSKLSKSPWWFLWWYFVLYTLLFQIISLLSTQTVLVFFQVSQLSIKSFFTQKFGKRSAFTGSSTQNEHMTQRKTIFQSTTFAYFKGARSRKMLSSFATMEKPNGTLRRHLPVDKSFQRDPNRCGDLTKKSSYRWFIFALATNILTFEILLQWKSCMVRCGAICRLTKAFKGTRIHAKYIQVIYFALTKVKAKNLAKRGQKFFKIQKIQNWAGTKLLFQKVWKFAKYLKCNLCLFVSI